MTESERLYLTTKLASFLFEKASKGFPEETSNALFIYCFKQAQDIMDLRELVRKNES